MIDLLRGIGDKGHDPRDVEPLFMVLQIVPSTDHDHLAKQVNPGPAFGTDSPGRGAARSNPTRVRRLHCANRSGDLRTGKLSVMPGQKAT